MDILRSALATYGLSVLLLTTIAIAKRLPNQSPAVRIWFETQLWGNATIEVCQHILGWQHPIYTFIYMGFTALFLIASAIVVWEAWNLPQYS